MNKEENRFYNYIYMDPEKPGIYPIKGLNIILKYEPFYVGKGTGYRINQHIYGHSKGFMKSKMISLKKKNLIPIKLKINNNITNFEACENEKYLIKIIGRRDLKFGPLCNLTNGGDEGTVGYKHTDEAKVKMSIGSKRKVYTKEFRDKLSKARKGKKFTEEHKKNISKGKIGNKMSDKTKQVISNYNSKTVNQYSLDNIFIKEWKSMIEASKQLNIEVSLISKNCRGICKTSKGFIWKYKIK